MLPKVKSAGIPSLAALGPCGSSGGIQALRLFYASLTAPTFTVVMLHTYMEDGGAPGGNDENEPLHPVISPLLRGGAVNRRGDTSQEKLFKCNFAVLHSI